MASVEKAGGAPVILPNSTDADITRSAVSRADGLLLTGGWDVDPRAYGRERHATVTQTDPLRDETEKAAIAEAMRLGLPIMAICRGIQIVNVAFGGTLIQDIPSFNGGNHRNVEHSIRVEAGSLAGRIWGRREMLVNSRHHQAIEGVGAGLRPTAWSPDGIIEAAEPADGYPLLALQCHPEDLWPDRPEFLAPFEWLVRLASK